MKNVKQMMMVAAIMLTAQAALAGGEIGNGGGGLKQDGKYLTFQSAGVEIPVEELRNPPGLKKLLSIFRAMPLPADARAQLIKGIYPNQLRKYFRMRDEGLSPEKRKELIQEYQRVFGDRLSNEKEVVLYAITRSGPFVDQDVTYLSSEFFKLTPTHQAVILFHEMLWVIAPYELDNYQFVVNTEMLFDRYLGRSKGRFGFDPDLFEAFDLLLLDHSVAFRSAAIEDYRRGRLRPFLNTKRRIPLSLLIGPSGLRFLGNYEDGYSVFDGDKDLIADWVLQMIQRYPSIQMFQAFHRVLPHVDIYGHIERSSVQTRGAKPQTIDFSIAPWIFEFSERSMDSQRFWRKGILLVPDSEKAFKLSGSFSDLFKEPRIRFFDFLSTIY